MRRTFLLSAVVTSFFCASPLVAQSGMDIPLTYDAFKSLTVKEAAGRLIGPAADLVSKMIIGLPPGSFGAPLSVVRFFSKPRAAEPGLCQQNEIDVWFETEDGRPSGSVNAFTPMKISSLRTGNGYIVVGDLTARFGERERNDLEQMCAGLDKPLAFFAADSKLQAWEAAYLVDVALREARRNDRESLNMTCTATKCDDAYQSLAKLSPRDIFDITPGCSHPSDGNSVCYSVHLDDPLGRYRSWLVYVESTKRADVGSGPRVTFKNASFTLTPQPVI